MTIFRGVGGGGSSTTDSELSALTALTQQAAGYRGEAAASATAAASSATAASSSASGAASSATAASSSASAASTSASNASTSASSAASSASAAATSATNAANSATEAANTAASFNDSNLVHKTGDETIAGAKTFSSTISGSVTGNAGTATTAGNVTGTVAVANGGTGATTATDARTNLGLGSLATLSSVSQTNLATNVAGNGPAFAAYANATQSITSGVETKVAINAENFDTASCFDVSTNRFTPTVAGYYQVDGVVRGASTSGSLWYAAIFKNGVRHSTGDQVNIASTSATQQCSISDLVYLNGSTDYIELYGYVTGTSPSFNFNSASITSRISGFLARAA